MSALTPEEVQHCFCKAPTAQHDVVMTEAAYKPLCIACGVVWWWQWCGGGGGGGICVCVHVHACVCDRVCLCVLFVRACV